MLIMKSQRMILEILRTLLTTIIFEKENNMFIAPDFGCGRTLFKIDI